MTYTAVPTQSPGDLWTAAMHNTYVQDNFAAVDARFTMARTRFVQFATGVVGASNLVQTYPGVALASGVYTLADLNLYMPDDYASSLVIKPVFRTDATAVAGSVVLDAWTYGGAVDEDDQGVKYTTGLQTVAVSGNYYYRTPSSIQIAASGAARGDFIHLRIMRDGTHASDTYTGTLWAIGVLLAYTANAWDVS